MHQALCNASSFGHPEERSENVKGKWRSVTISGLKQLATSPESLELSESYFLLLFSCEGNVPQPLCNDAAVSRSQKIGSGSPQDWHGYIVGIRASSSEKVRQSTQEM